MNDIDHSTNHKYMEVLNSTLTLLSQNGIKDIFLIGSVGVSGHLSRPFKTFGDVEGIAKPEDLKKIVKALSQNGYEVLEDLDDRTAFRYNGVWIGFIDRSEKFRSFGLDSAGAYEHSINANLYDVDFKCLNKKYLQALYEIAIEKTKRKKKNQYESTLKLLNAQ